MRFQGVGFSLHFPLIYWTKLLNVSTIRWVLSTFPTDILVNVQFSAGYKRKVAV